MSEKQADAETWVETVVMPRQTVFGNPDDDNDDSEGEAYIAKGRAQAIERAAEQANIVAEGEKQAAAPAPRRGRPRKR